MTQLTENKARRRALIATNFEGVLGVLILAIIAISAFTALPDRANSQQSAAPAAATTSSKPVVDSDLAERVAKFRLVHMPFNSQALSTREKKMIDKLVDAS